MHRFTFGLPFSEEEEEEGGMSIRRARCKELNKMKRQLIHEQQPQQHHEPKSARRLPSLQGSDMARTGRTSSWPGSTFRRQT